jgi:tetratricopeptide (TPR) repeat protein
MRAERFHWPALWILAGAVGFSHLLGAGPLRSALWGANAYAFLPRAALAIALVLLAAVLALAVRPPAWLDRVAPDAAAGRAKTWLPLLAAMAGAFLVCWVFREGHTLLGDGGPLTRSLPQGQRFHPHQPLTFVIHQWFYGIARGLVPSAGGDPSQVARDTVALSSAIAGALFVPVAWGLAGELARARPADPGARDARALRLPLCLVLLAQGYVQLFLGYVENYTFHALTLGVYLLASLRTLRGAAPLALAAMALVLDVSLDLSSVLLVPSFGVLVAIALARPGSRWPALRDLALAGLLAAAISALMASVRPGFHLAGAAAQVVRQALFGIGSRAESLGYMVSGVHVRDFLNAQMLIGPAASFLFVAGLAWLVVARARIGAAGAFLLAAGLASLAGAWVATDLGLGYARDWDLFAPSGVALTTAGLHLAMNGAWRTADLRRWLLALAAVCLFHTVPWVALNTSFDRSFARFQTLPLGLGRTEAAVGAHYLAQGDTAQAIAWLRRSVEAYPGNNVAAYRLGEIAMRRAMYADAAFAFSVALRSRPDKDLYRFSLVDAIVRGGAPPEWARPQVDTLVMRHPEEPLYWAALGVVCLGTGEGERAASAFQRASALAPDDSAFTRLARLVPGADAYRRAIREDWPTLAGD